MMTLTSGSCISAVEFVVVPFDSRMTFLSMKGARSYYSLCRHEGLVKRSILQDRMNTDTGFNAFKSIPLTDFWPVSILGLCTLF
jgi:hypothetical protein